MVVIMAQGLFCFTISFRRDCDQHVQYRSSRALELAFVCGVFVSVRFEVEVRGGVQDQERGLGLCFLA